MAGAKSCRTLSLALSLSPARTLSLARSLSLSLRLRLSLTLCLSLSRREDMLYILQNELTNDPDTYAGPLLVSQVGELSLLGEPV